MRPTGCWHAPFSQTVGTKGTAMMAAMSQGQIHEAPAEEGQADVLCLSNAGQLELVRAAMEQDVSLRMTVRGFSMTPFIRDGDVLLIDPLRDQPLCMGEVVAAVLPPGERLVVHRLVSRSSGGWLIRGDNCPEADGMVEPQAVLGRVVRVARDGCLMRAGMGPERTLIALVSRVGGLRGLRTLRRWRRAHRRVTAMLARQPGAEKMQAEVRGSPEMSALLACAKAVVDGEGLPGLMRSMKDCRSAEGLCTLALQQGMLGHLHKMLADQESTFLPLGLTERLNALHRTMELNNLRSAATLLGLLRVLERGGVRAIAVKGPVWAELLYGDLSARTWSDLDLLVGYKQVDDARALLLKKGFEDCLASNDMATASRRSGNGQIALASSGAGLIVDLHWRLTVSSSSRDLTFEDISARASTLGILGHQVACPGQADVLLISCLAGARDLWATVGRMLDLAAQIVRVGDDDWQRVLDTAKSSGCERRTLAGVLHVCRTLGLQVPGPVARKCEGRSKVPSLVGALQLPVAIASSPPDLGETLRRTRWHRLGEDRALDRLRFALNRLFAPTAEDWESVDLPRGLSWLYYPLRPLRLAAKWAKRVLMAGRIP